jgi:hypothetical protein
VTTSAVKPPPAPTSQARRIIALGPLFGGYTVVAVVAAWLVGIALRASDILPPHALPWAWLALAGTCAMLATLATLLTPLLAQGRLRLLYLALRLLLMPTFRTPKYALFAIFSDPDNSRPFLA